MNKSKKIFQITTGFAMLFALISIFIALTPKILWYQSFLSDNKFSVANANFLEGYFVFVNFFIIIMMISTLCFIIYLISSFFVKKQKDQKIIDWFFVINFIIQAILIFALLTFSASVLSSNIDYEALIKQNNEILVERIKKDKSIQATIYAFSYIFAIGLFSSCVFFFVKRKEMYLKVS